MPTQSPTQAPTDLVVRSITWGTLMCCFEEDQISDTEEPIADSLGLEVSDVNATSWTKFGSFGEEVLAGDRRRFLASTDEAWNIEYVISILGIENTSITADNLNDDAFVNEIGNSISTSLNIDMEYISTRNVSVLSLTSSPTSTPAQITSLPPTFQSPTFEPTANTLGGQAQASADTTLPIVLVFVIGIGFLVVSVVALKIDYRAIKKDNAKPLNDPLVPPSSTNI